MWGVLFSIMEEKIVSKKSKGPMIKTPVGTLAYPYLLSEDVGGRFSDGKYKTSIIFEGAAAEEIKAAVHAFVSECGYKTKGKKGDPIKEVTDADGNVVEGQVKLTAKSSFRPNITDCGRNVIADNKGVYVDTPIWGGTQARLALRLNDYDEGVNIYLLSVKIIDLVTADGVDWDDDDEGYVAPAPKAKQESTPDADEDSSEEDLEDSEF